jgi:glutamyl/glutaminyl-tRNA synthetase
VLYEAFGWKPPVFVHLPLLHSMSGRKLSKRDTKTDASFLVKEYETNGILPEALVNYVALFGWSSKTDSDVHSMDDLIARVYPQSVGLIVVLAGRVDGWRSQSIT